MKKSILFLVIMINVILFNIEPKSSKIKSENGVDSLIISRYDDRSDYLGQNFMFDYFVNLTNSDEPSDTTFENETNVNMLYNPEYMGNCGYVSMCQLLTYYDTYYNDNIVDDEMVVKSEITTNAVNTKSPGCDSHMYIFKQYIINETDTSHFPAINMNLAKSLSINQNSLFGDLIISAVRTDILNPDTYVQDSILSVRPITSYQYDSSFFRDNSADYLDFMLTSNMGISYGGFDTTGEERKTILDDYFSRHNITGLSVTCTTYDKTDTTDQSNAYSRCLQLINQGIPVNLGIETADGYKHSVVAYYANGTDLIMHFGYNKYSLCYASDLEDLVINSITYITLSTLGHECSLNYYIGDNGCCPHTFDSHVHYYSYTKNGSSNHICDCYCGHSTTESHSFTTVGVKMICSKCGYIATTSEIFPIAPDGLKKEEEEEDE